MAEFSLPETRYALSGEVNIAYQVLGQRDGRAPIDIVMVPGIISHIEFQHELPGYTAFLRRLATFARVIAFDKRGQGLSDRIAGAPSLEERMDDVRAVMEAAGSRRAAIFGFSEGCALSALFAATYPELVSHLVLCGGFTRSADRAPPGEFEAMIEHLLSNWGRGGMIHTVAPSHAILPENVAQFGKLERLAASPGAMRAIMHLNAEIDVAPILSSVRVPTLVLHRRTDRRVPVALGARLAAAIPGARFVEYPDGDHAYWAGDAAPMLGDIEEFLTGQREHEADELERVLATVLFTDIVDSTRRAAELGDQKWRGILDSHDRLAHQSVERHRGTLVKTTGDGILATFDGPGRAVRCALAFSQAAGQLGLPLRAGLHTGEIEMRGRDVGGIAVHAAARVMAQAQPGETLVSRVVTDLVAGAGLGFAERGSHELKGIPGRWDLFAARL